jgi:hypothetical protein
MKTYRKKPIEVEAVQYVGTNYLEIREWSPAVRPLDSERLVIQTLEGAMYADMGDWIIRGVKGEFYPCKPDVFALTYDESPQPEPTSYVDDLVKGVKDLRKDLQNDAPDEAVGCKVAGGFESPEEVPSIVNPDTLGGNSLFTFINKDFTEDDYNKGLIAGMLQSDGSISKVSNGNNFMVVVRWLSRERHIGTNIPMLCAVQVRGLARLKYNTDYNPRINDVVAVNSNGGVYPLPIPLNESYRGQIIAVDVVPGTCDVWLG